MDAQHTTDISDGSQPLESDDATAKDSESFETVAGAGTEKTVIHALYDSPLGTLYLAATDSALVGSWFESQAHFPTPHVLSNRVQLNDHPVLKQAAEELTEYFAGQRQTFEVALDPDGTDFQLAVWDALKDIPFGYTTTYGHISKIVGPGAPAQAVGQAVGHNKISIFIPCHRVLSVDGKLTGYAGGIERKQYLLDLEAPSAEEEGRLF